MDCKKKVFVERIKQLRQLMKLHGIDWYIIVSGDYHASEYVGDYFKCREYISGFDGSAGTLVIGMEEACLWTDGRYFIQARQQLEGTGIILQRMGQEGVPEIKEYLRDNMQSGMCLGYDGRTIRVSCAENIKKCLSGISVTYIENIDLVNEIWKDRPSMSAQDVYILDEQYSGKSTKDKLSDLRSSLSDNNADKLLISSLDDIAWLYNIRGNDIAYNPVALAYTIVGREEAILYINEACFDNDKTIIGSLATAGVRIKPYGEVYNDLSKLDACSLMLDKDAVNVALITAIPDCVKIINATNPTTLAKAIKNSVEIDNERRAHVLDGVAVTRLIYWLKQVERTGKVKQLTELDVCKKLEFLRSKGEGYIEQSFAPIAAYGTHGAIVHYEPTVETNAKLDNSSFLLLDTGGHYLSGTTDITRTIALGELTYEQKMHYTAVLRGNLNLAAAHFKYGCTGANLDYLARESLWELGLDYNHGTGHGVGYLLNVHEKPNSFRLKEPGLKPGTIFEEGMITSDEPGLYIEGEYGIRLENMVLCKKSDMTEYGQFMEFETLTVVPFDRAAILPELMSKKEIDLLNSYHKKVYETIAPYLNDEEKNWLAGETCAF